MQAMVAACHFPAQGGRGSPVLLVLFAPSDVCNDSLGSPTQTKPLTASWASSAYMRYLRAKPSLAPARLALPGLLPFPMVVFHRNIVAAMRTLFSRAPIRRPGITSSEP